MQIGDRCTVSVVPLEYLRNTTLSFFVKYSLLPMVSNQLCADYTGVHGLLASQNPEMSSYVYESVGETQL